VLHRRFDLMVARGACELDCNECDAGVA